MPVPSPPETEAPNPERIGAREDFARELTLLRLRAGLTVRQVATRSDTFRNHSTIGDWFAGRGLPSTSSRELLVRVLAACGVDDPALVTLWLSAWQRVRRTPGRRPRGPEPYRGLAGFEPEHAEWFFGREALTRELVDRLAAVDEDAAGTAGVQVVVGVSRIGQVVAAARRTGPRGASRRASRSRLVDDPARPRAQCDAATRHRPRRRTPRRWRPSRRRAAGPGRRRPGGMPSRVAAQKVSVSATTMVAFSCWAQAVGDVGIGQGGGRR
ncbi:helix-turn-helix transcriptional regulator [Streptosporangium oxazolinicum]|uniref:helix-turn-helix transcriptional regulator n=1 Tax=Streptosporangium oxazolinicum TaxID=909287 RepID=UPI0031E52151